VSETLDLEAACAGRAPAMRRLLATAARAAALPTTILITGETGTGKGVLARAIHGASPRRDLPFVHVDCAGLAGGLLEAELYGVARGAYTGAHSARAGRFETAAAGTLFLDEIGELPISGQQKLLRVLEEGTWERLGETRTRRLRARVVAATHRDLVRGLADRSFRADLYHRLRVLTLEVPPLRDRREDLADWIERACARAAARLGLAAPHLECAALDRLRAHRWPGNLRELFHVMEAATIRAEGGRVDAALLGGLLLDAPQDECETQESARCGATVPACSTIRAPAGFGVEQLREEIAGAGGNVSLAARRLGIPRSTLRNRVGLDDAGGRMRRRRRGSSERAEAAPDESQRDQGEGEPVELREARVVDAVEHACSQPGAGDGARGHAREEPQVVEEGKASDAEDEQLGEMARRLTGGLAPDQLRP
jgi:DNA-binding NtrC family response regulator